MGKSRRGRREYGWKLGQGPTRVDKSRARIETVGLGDSGPPKRRGMSKRIVILGAAAPAPRSFATSCNTRMRRASPCASAIWTWPRGRTGRRGHPAASVFPLDAWPARGPKSRGGGQSRSSACCRPFFIRRWPKMPSPPGLTLITPSYLSSEIAALDAAAKTAGIPILNELGWIRASIT